MMSAITLAAFVRRHWPSCSQWPREALLGWVRWFILRDLCAWHRDAAGRIDAVGFGRPVRDVAEAQRDPWHYEPGSRVFYVDLLAVRKDDGALTIGGAWQFFLRYARLRLGEICEVGWERWSRGRGARGRPVETLERAFGAKTANQH